MKPYGIGSLPSASWRGVRGRESGLLQATRPATVASLQKSIDEKTRAASRAFFSPAFRVEAPDYGTAPRSNKGDAVAALRGLSGLGDVVTCDWNEDVKPLRVQLQMRLSRVSPGIKVMAESILDQTDWYNRTGGVQTPCEKMNLVQQALSAAINDIRAQEGKLPKDASGKLVTPSGPKVPSVDTTKLASDTKPSDITPQSVPDAGFLPSVFPNGWCNRTRYIVTAGVGVLVLAAIGVPIMRAIK